MNHSEFQDTLLNHAPPIDLSFLDFSTQNNTIHLDKKLETINIKADEKDITYTKLERFVTKNDDVIFKQHFGFLNLILQNEEMTSKLAINLVEKMLLLEIHKMTAFKYQKQIQELQYLDKPFKDKLMKKLFTKLTSSNQN